MIWVDAGSHAAIRQGSCKGIPRSAIKAEESMQDTSVVWLAPPGES